MTTRNLYASAASAAMLCATMAQAQTADETLAAKPAGSSQSTATTTGQPADIADDVIVVTARKRAELITNVPISITALSNAKLVEANISDAYDLARVVPNLTVQPGAASPGAVQTFSIRGQTQTDNIASFDSPVATYFDGVALPRAIAFAPSLVDVSRVEVLRGPQGTLYGRNTTGGAISFYSRDPVMNQLSGFLTGEYGNYDHYKLQGAINIPLISDALAARFVASYTNRDGYGHSLVERLGDLEQQYYRGKLRFDNGGPFKAALTVDYAKVQGTNIPSQFIQLTSLNTASLLPGQVTSTLISTSAAREAGLVSPLAGFALLQQSLPVSRGGLYTGGFYDNTVSIPQPFDGKRLGSELNMSYELSDRFKLTSISGYQNAKRFNVLDSDSTQFTLISYSGVQKSRFFSEEDQISYSGDRINVIAGAYYSRESGSDNTDAISLGAINPLTNLQRIDFRYQNLGAFGQTDVKLTDHLTLTGGIRWSQERKQVIARSKSFNRTTGVTTCSLAAAILDTPGICQATFDPKFSDVSWLGSLDYKVSGGLLLYAKASKGFKGGGINFRVTSAPQAVPFDPESVIEYETGIKLSNRAKTITLNVAGFYDDYTNIQRSVVVVQGTPPTTSTVVRNAASATIKGIEADFVLRPSERFEVSGNAAYIDAHYNKFITVDPATGLPTDASNTPFIIPKVQLGVAAKYTLPTSFGDAFVRADYYYIGKRFLSDAAVNVSQLQQNGYGLLGARVQFNLRRWDATLAFYGTNLTDKKYLTFAIGLDGSLGYSYANTGEPRMYGISITKRFGND